jgi:hypothetical protein
MPPAFTSAPFSRIGNYEHEREFRSCNREAGYAQKEAEATADHGRPQDEEDHADGNEKEEKGHVRRGHAAWREDARLMRWFVALALILAGYAAWGQAQNFQPGANPVSNQGYSSAAVTPSDTANIAVTRALYVGNASACNINMQLNGDTAARVWVNVQPGEIIPVQAIAVKNTSTTCGNILAIY